MPHLATSDCAKIALLFEHTLQAGVSCEMTFAVRDVTGYIFANAGPWASTVFAHAATHLIPALGYTTEIYGVVFEDVRTVPYGGADYTFPAVHGTWDSSGPGVPTSAALAVKKLTGSYGRAHRGRLFWPTWSLAMFSAPDVIGSAYADTVTAALQSFQEDLEGDTHPVDVGVISQQENKVVRANGLFERITGWQVADLNVDSMRRRLAGRGR